MAKQLPGAASYESNVLADRLRKAVKDKNYDLIPYEELGKLIDRTLPHDTAAAGYLRTARNIVERESGCMFDVKPGEGVKMCTVKEQAATPVKQRDKLRRHTRRALKRMALVKYDELSASDQREHTVTSSILGAVHMFTRRKGVERLRGAASTTQRPLAISETLKLFTNGNGDDKQDPT